MRRLQRKQPTPFFPLSGPKMILPLNQSINQSDCRKVYPSQWAAHAFIFGIDSERWALQDLFFHCPTLIHLHCSPPPPPFPIPSSRWLRFRHRVLRWGIDRYRSRRRCLIRRLPRCLGLDCAARWLPADPCCVLAHNCRTHPCCPCHRRRRKQNSQQLSLPTHPILTRTAAYLEALA